MKEPKIVLWDIETSGIVATTWNLHPESISHKNMIQDWFIICAAWKELGKDKIETVSVLDNPERLGTKGITNDYHVIKTLRDMLQDVDILVHHNGDKFDIKMFTTRLIYHNLPPLPKLTTVDTLKEVRKVARFTSNRLDFLGHTLAGIGKQETPEGTWLKSMQGDPDAIHTMVEYNKQDVNVLEAVYLKLRPYMKNHPHRGVLEGNEPAHSCPKCGSTNVHKDGIRLTAAGYKRQEMKCNDCGGYHSTTLKAT